MNIWEPGCRFRVRQEAPKHRGLLGTVSLGLHFNQAGQYGIEVVMDSLPYQKTGPNDPYTNWLVSVVNLALLEPLGDGVQDTHHHELETTT